MLPVDDVPAAILQTICQDDNDAVIEKESEGYVPLYDDEDVDDEGEFWWFD